ncbi:MAG: hypoxanthine phosphoribosyltransferase [Candidatus Marinimicrobia bacterium]|jgi:hypoxanthine phosphoribosyltransferase|nr:hypoxanthine phosphoribosyltransferase [Candidatus Neomarinimicrobiota bacterium]
MSSSKKSLIIDHEGPFKGQKLDRLFSEKEIQARVKELADQISHDLKNAKKPPILVGVLNGSLFFMADLMRAMSIETEMDFIKIASYHHTSSTGTVRLVKDISAQITDRDVLIVEDIVDTGLSINFLRNRMLSNAPHSLQVVTFLYKKEVSQLKKEPEYIGFVIPNRYVVGYGLDLDQKYRTLRDIYAFVDNKQE